MVCPYRVIVALVTVALACLISMDYMKKTDDEDCEKKKTPLSWKERGVLYKALYVAGIATLIVFHLELFSGGYFCKLIFAKTVVAPDDVVLATI